MTLHAIERAADRLGVDLSEEDMASIRGMLERREYSSKVLTRTGMIAARIRFQGRSMDLLYHPFSFAIITVFGPGQGPLAGKAKAKKAKAAKREVRKDRPSPPKVARACRAAAKAERDFEKEEADA